MKMTAYDVDRASGNGLRRILPHHVGTLAETASGSGTYAEHADGYARFPIVDRAAGSVHQTLAVAELAPGGRVDLHAHACKEAIYVLEGGSC